MDTVLWGEVMSMKTRACFEVLDDYYLGMNYVCYEHKIIPNNNFGINQKAQLTYRDKCLGFDPPNPALYLVECPVARSLDYGVWDLVPRGHVWGQIRVKRKTSENKTETYCITQVTNVLKIHHHEQMPQLGPCDEDNDFQIWAFSYHFDFNHTSSKFARVL